MIRSIAPLFFVVTSAFAQDLPYREIPASPPKFTTGAVTGRMLDGVGFRFYWATEGLRDEDLHFKPSAEARSSIETIEHIHVLSLVMLNAISGLPYKTDENPMKLSFTELRRVTLQNLKNSSDRIKLMTDSEIERLKIIFLRGNDKMEYPFWNALNGPIADMLWHIGQVVTFRRSTGNPFNSNADVFTGTLN